MMKRIIALLLSLVMLLGILPGCAEGHFRFDNDTNLTRGEWIDTLAKTFGLDEYTKEEPYLSDVSSDDPIFKSVQSCCEWGVLRDVTNKLKKQDSATLEFVVTTAVYATGADLSAYDGKDYSEKAIKYAEINKIVDEGLHYNERATGQQCSDILAAAQNAYLNTEINPIDKVVLNAAVSDERTTNAIKSVGNDTYLFSGKKPSVGDVCIAPGTKENPDGVAIKITDVTDNGDGTYSAKTMTPELYEVFDEVEYAGVAVPKLEDIVPANGVTISGLDSGSLSPVSYQQNNTPFAELPHENVSTGKTTNLSFTSNNVNGLEKLAQGNKSEYAAAPLKVGTSEKNALSFSANFNFTKGTVSISPQWGSIKAEMEQLITSGHIASPDAGEWFSKTSVFPDKTLFGPDPYSNDSAIEAYKKGVISADELREALEGMNKDDSNFVYDPENKYTTSQEGHEKIPKLTNKFEGGYEIVGSVAITDFYVQTSYKLKTAKLLGVDTGVPTGIDSYSIQINYGADVSASVKGKITEELTVCSVPVSLGGAGTIKVDLILYGELNGEIAVKASIDNNTKTDYSAGKAKKTCQQTSSVSAEANVTFEVGPKVKAKIYLFTVPLIDITVSAAVQVNSSGSVNYSTDWTETDECFVIDRNTTWNYNLNIYVPIVKLAIGTDGSTLANKLKITFTWTIIGAEGSNAPLKAQEYKLAEKEYSIWQDHQELPKNPNENPKGDSNNSNDNLGSNMDISSYYIHLKKGATCTIDLQYPAGYSAENFSWKSSDTSVVTVKDGELNAKNVGSAIITAKSSDGKYYATCAVYVGE